ncbi:MAG TPA: hypothetical protein PLU22_23085, partial [Polyangiaceae bacterium]|nr:hypothetical protein [Polyangiaceae bacterium]
MTSTSPRPWLAAVTALVIGACDEQLTVGDEVAPSTSGDERWTGNPPDCPEDPPVHGDACSVAEGQICAYFFDSLENPGYQTYQACGCWAASGGSKLFHCYDGTSGPPCPTEEPVAGSDCSGMIGMECHYPERTVCTCALDGAPADWLCEERGVRTFSSATPAGVDPATPLSELSGEERTAWCEWYRAATLGPGYPEPPLAAVDANGYTVSGACSMGRFSPCDGRVPDLPSVQCEANLALSTCAAPVAALTDCLLTILDSCWPSPRGCAPYLDQPGCNGTMVIGNDQGEAETS